MKLTDNQKKLYEAGLKAKELTNDMCLKAAIRYLYNNNLMTDILNVLPNDPDNVFFEAGLDGFTPEWRQAFRYGEIPESGYSVNWGTGEREKGVSCVCLIGGENEKSETIYDTIYGLQDTKKILIEGWYLGNSGSDGEPLLVNARVVKNERGSEK